MGIEATYLKVHFKSLTILLLNYVLLDPGQTYDRLVFTKNSIYWALDIAPSKVGSDYKLAKEALKSRSKSVIKWVRDPAGV